MSIEINNLTKIYNTQRAVDNISFKINSGQIVGFIGPNGAGKSTTMKVIAGFIDKYEGNVNVCGYDAKKDNLEIRRLIGYLPEHDPLYADLYIKEYLSFICGVYKLDNINKRITNVIEQTGLGVEQHKKIHALSKGYKQRVGLAASIIHDPKVLILDEPTTGLDPNQIVEIRSLIASLGSKKTVMLSTHIMQEVEAICNNVIIINKGIIVANDKAENLSIYSAKGIKSIFVEFLAENDFQTSFLSESVEKIENKGNNKYIAYSKTDIREDIFKWAVTNNEILISMNLQEKNLEDMFRELTKDIKQSNA